jgi:diguanylate cyclase (GGDEF)-like protein
LTGLKNVRTFKQRLEEEFQRAERYELPLAVILLDVDRFKDFNDRFGHPAGDEVLVQVASLINDGCRNTDFPARYGGEEFVILLPNTDEREAADVAERIRKLLENHGWSQRAITSSFGVAGRSHKSSTSELLVKAADQALYAAKKSGRNQVCCWSSL